MAEHLLYGTQVGASFEQVGGKTVAQGVGADVFLNAAGLAPFLDDVEYHDAAQPASASVEKEYVFVAPLGSEVAALFQVELYLVQCTL